MRPPSNIRGMGERGRRSDTIRDTLLKYPSSLALRCAARRGMTNFIGQKQWLLRALCACVVRVRQRRIDMGNSSITDTISPSQIKCAPPGLSPIQKKDESNRMANRELAFGQLPAHSPTDGRTRASSPGHVLSPKDGAG